MQLPSPQTKSSWWHLWPEPPVSPLSAAKGERHAVQREAASQGSPNRKRVLGGLNEKPGLTGKCIGTFYSKKKKSTPRNKDDRGV